MTGESVAVVTPHFDVGEQHSVVKAGGSCEGRARGKEEGYDIAAPTRRLCATASLLFGGGDLCR